MPIQYVAPKSSTYTFTDEILDKKLIFQVIKLNGTVMIYVNERGHPSCTSLEMAMVTRFSVNPSTTTLLGKSADRSGSAIASRVSKKLQKVVLLSLNVENMQFIVPQIEKRLSQEISQYPEKF